MEISGDPISRFTVLDYFFDDQMIEVLGESGVDLSCVGAHRN